MQLKVQSDSKSWDDFIAGHKYGGFLQSFGWGKFKRKIIEGWEIHRLGFLENGGMMGAAQVFEKGLPLGQKLFYIPRGPVVDWRNGDEVKKVLNHVEAFAKERGAFLIKMEPPCEEGDFSADLLKDLGWKHSENFVQPPDTIKIDLRPSEEEVLASFDRRRRYDIRLAQKKGLKVENSSDPEDVRKFYSLLEKTAARQRFPVHSEEYYKTLVEEMGDHARFYFVKKEDKIVSTALVITFGKEAVHLAAAMDYEFRKFRPNPLRDFSCMLGAKSAGCEWFDLWGLSTKVPNPGLEEYKRGFSKNYVKYPGMWERRLSALKYGVFRVMERVRA